MSSNSSDKFYDALQESLDPPKLYTPLHIAARDGKINLVKKLLLYSNIDVNNAENGYDMTPLHLAAEKGYIDIVKALLKQPGINPEQKDGYGRTPLDLANYKGYTEVVNAFQDEAFANRKYKNRKKFKSLLASAKTPRDSKVGGRRKSGRATKLKRKRQTKRRRR
jgi:ankyrin repeat protein